MTRRKISILGSTGSIGENALRVIRNLGDDFQVALLSCRNRWESVLQQARDFGVDTVVITDPGAARRARQEAQGVRILSGREGLLEAAARTDIDLMLNALVGAAGMEPTCVALSAGVDVALSNKESLVMAGDLISRIRQQTGAHLYPIDSEHSAIWQCLAGEKPEEVRRLILTGSGGPFRTRPLDTFSRISVEEALRHPNWDMGAKITIDSATMMNKGLEVIEAHWLFQLPPEQIDIVVHPQSIIHSMVEFVDGSIKAQLGVPDMKIPIQYALMYPRHAPAPWERLDLTRVATLTFEPVDTERFPSIRLAYQALARGGSAPAALNVANEQAVYRFLQGDLMFTQIPDIIANMVEQHPWIPHPDLDDLRQLEAEITRQVQEWPGQKS